VWETARANMRNYLILRDKVRAFRADPEVQHALVESRVLDLWEPTLAPGETLADLRSATYDLDGLAKQGMHFERLDQLALEYLYGVR
jgi:xylose isomerase